MNIFHSPHLAEFYAQAGKLSASFIAVFTVGGGLHRKYLGTTKSKTQILPPRHEVHEEKIKRSLESSCGLRGKETVTSNRIS